MEINGPAVKALREAKGLTIRALAAKAAIDVAWLWRIENGTKTAPDDAIERIAAAFPVDVKAISYPTPLVSEGKLRRAVELLTPAGSDG